MIWRLTILACLCLLPALAGLAKAALAPAFGEVIVDNAVATPDDLPAEAARPEPAGPPAVITLPPSSEPARTSANPLWTIPLSALTATRERPIFSASRRPPPPTVAPVTTVRTAPPRPTEPEKPHLTLVGTIVGDADSFGIFIDQTGNAPLRLKLGEQHDGWTLRSVQKREATLEKDQQSVVVAMPQPGNAGEGETQLLPSLTRAVAAEPDRPTRRLH
jgi:general secretion pathway protein N